MKISDAKKTKQQFWLLTSLSKNFLKTFLNFEDFIAAEHIEVLN